MNNPYRARPARSRVDHAAVSGYGAQNQNAWGSMPPRPQQGIPPVVDQRQPQSQDPWDWGADNANNVNSDSWNWSVVDQPESQSQQFVPTYANSGQNVSSSMQTGHYYQNVNGNNRSQVVDQLPPSGRNLSRTGQSRESTPNHNESYNQYMPYGYNQQPQPQQYPFPPRPNSKSSPALSDHSQRSNSQQSPSIPVIHQSVQKNQTPPMSDINNTYNLDNGDQRNIHPQQNWQNYKEVPTSGYWHDTGSLVNTRVENFANQWHQPTMQHPQPSTPQAFVPTNEPIPPVNDDHSVNRVTQQENDAKNQWSSHQAYVTPNEPMPLVVDQNAGNVNSTDLNDWHQIQSPPSQFASSTGSTTSSSVTNLPNSVERNPMPQEHNIERKHSVNVAPPDNVETDWNVDGEWNTIPTHELSSGLSQLSLSSKSEKPESQPVRSEVHSSVHSTGTWSSQTVSGSRSEIAWDNTVPENVPVLRNEHSVESMENLHIPESDRKLDSQSTVATEPLPHEHSPLTAFHPGNARSQESNAPLKPGYDQWYVKQAASDHQNQLNKWSPEQNIENYENIQQPVDFVNLEVVAPVLQNRDIYGSHDSINRETLDNDPKSVTSPPKETASSRDFHQEINNVEVPLQRLLHQEEQAPDNYEFASNDRNTFLETGELTDSHPEHEPTPPSQDDENDEVPNDIPFLREVPGQSSNSEPPDNPVPLARTLLERSERRDVPLQQPRNGPSGEERDRPQRQVVLPPEPAETREIPGRATENEEPIQQTDSSGFREIPGGASPSEDTRVPDDIDRDRDGTRVVTGSLEVGNLTAKQDPPSDVRNKREEAVGGASVGDAVSGGPGKLNRRDSYEDVDDDGSGNSRDGSRERRRDYDYDRKGRYYDRDREYDDDYYFDRRRVGDYDQTYNSREDLERREGPYRQDEHRRHTSRDNLERRARDREDPERRVRGIQEPDERRRKDDDRRRPKDPRDYDRYPRDRDYAERDRRREDRRGRRYEDYADPRDPYRRDFYEDPYARGSRPSSRSSYVPISDREYQLRSRDPYYGYNGYGGRYEYGANYNSNYYAYLENLRRTNPQAYSEWYHKYYASQQHQQLPGEIGRGVANYAEDRASVHSGRSSCDDRTTGDKRMVGDMSLPDSTIASARLTPTKYSTSHVHAAFSVGALLHVQASYPAEGELARVDVLRVSSLLAHDPLVRELVAYPGPLIKQVGITHKKTIIEYCEAKIKKAESNEYMEDAASYILLYQLMIMLIRQNGNVVGVDIAELLLSNKKAYPQKSQVGVRRESVISQRSGAAGGSGDEHVRETVTPLEKDETGKSHKSLSIEQITDKFRELLLYGCGQEALEYAMNKGLWGHALFLASKLDKRTHASVMTRFANGLTANDPLQTLYQLHSGRVPASVTCVSEPKWGDWRPHLAMIISNTSPNPEINCRSITTLGDTLAARGHIHAAHFCYILAQVDFGPYGINTSKLVLLGSDPHKPYAEFVTTEGVMLTEIYEYARYLSEPGFTLVDLQTFKYELAVKMVDHGLTEKALLYVEQIAVNISREPSKYKSAFIERVYTLGDRIKYHDPVCKDSVEDAANLTWLSTLAEIVDKYRAGEFTIQEGRYEPHVVSDKHNVPHQEEHYQEQVQQWGAAQQEYEDGPASMMEAPTMDSQQDWQPISLPANIQDPYNSNGQNTQLTQNDYWTGGQQVYSQPEYTSQEYLQPEWQQHDADNTIQQQQRQQDEWNYESEKEEKPPSTLEPQPTISMGPSSGKQFDPLAELDALDKPSEQAPKSSTENRKAPEKQSDKKNTSTGGSWFGGLFSKLAPRPKNQMILPDDNNPTIVWDPVAKKWSNKEDNGEGSSGPLAPPPKATEMGFKVPPTEIAAPVESGQSDESAPTGSGLSKPPMGNNMFKMPKGRSLRANYIDVMNPGGNGGTESTLNTPVVSPVAPIASSSPQLRFLIPAPVNDPGAPMDFLTHAQAPVGESNQSQPQQQQQQGGGQLSRWSSASSLSREVQSYTMRDPRLLQQDKGPMMFNPTDMKDAASKKTPRNRYPPR